MKLEPLTFEEQTNELADRYSQRAEAYDALWSPIIRPVGERLSSADDEQYLYRGDVFTATAVKADHPARNH